MVKRTQTTKIEREEIHGNLVGLSTCIKFLVEHKGLPLCVTGKSYGGKDTEKILTLIKS